MKRQLTQSEIALKKLAKHGILRLVELNKYGVSSTTVNRMVSRGKIERLTHGLYQLPNSCQNIDRDIAIVSKQIPNGVLCLVSALYINKVITSKPAKVWVAINKNSWTPKNLDPAIQLIRYSDKFHSESVQRVKICGVSVKVFRVAKTLADCFRHRNKIGPEIAYKSLELALYYNKTSISDLITQSELRGVSNLVRPRFEAWYACKSI